MGFSHPLVELTLLRLRTFYRETGAVFWTFGFPIALSVVLGVAFRDRPPEPAVVAVIQGPGAESLYRKLAASREVKASLRPEAEARELLRTGKVELLIEPGPQPTYVYDPQRPEGRVARYVAEHALRGGDAPERRIVEPGARYIDFLVPGLIGSNVMSSSMWGIGYTLVEMRNKRLIKRLVATPMRRSHFLLSFVLMRIVFLALELLFLLLFGSLVFGVPLRGSLLLVCSLSLLGSLSFAGLGLLVAARVDNMPTINGLINLVILPMFLGSGVFFSTARFPDAVQPLLKALPLTALNDSLRAVMLDGAGARAVWLEAAVMAAYAVLTFVIALRIFKWR
jgi:ABC-type multidrug transport system permease subunit